MSGIPYSDNDIALLKELYATYKGNIAKEFNRRAEVKRDENAIRMKACKLGIQRCFHHYMTDEQSEWIKNNIDSHYSIHTCWEEYCAIFQPIGEKIFQRWIYRDLNIKRLKGSTRPIGSIRWERDNKRIKVSNTGDHDKDWPYESHIIWEEYYGKIPDGNFIIHLDGDNRNNSIDNLAMIDPRTNMILGKNGWFSKGEITKAGVAYAKLHFAIKDAKK